MVTPLPPAGKWVRHGKVKFDLPRGRWTFQVWPYTPARCPTDGRGQGDAVPDRPGQLVCLQCGIDLSV